MLSHETNRHSFLLELDEKASIFKHSWGMKGSLASKGQKEKNTGKKLQSGQLIAGLLCRGNNVALIAGLLCRGNNVALSAGLLCRSNNVALIAGLLCRGNNVALIAGLLCM